MSMKFAGFMGAVREDRLAKEKREEDEKARQADYNFRTELQDREFGHRKDIASLDLVNEQRKKDAALSTDVSTFLGAYNLPRSAAPYVRQEIRLRGGLGNATKAYDEGLFAINVPAGGTASSGGSAKLSGDASVIRDEFMTTVYEGGLTNPYGLAAVMSTAKHESGFSPTNVNRTWQDDSETGRPGTAGGIMSWNNDRLRNMQEFTGGDGSPAAQARFFLQEDPELVARLNTASSAEEAQTMMNNAWKFAGYNREGNEQVAARLNTAKALVPEIETMFMFESVEKAPEAVADNIPEGVDTPGKVAATTSTDTQTANAFGVTRRTKREIDEAKAAADRLRDGKDNFTTVIGKADTLEKLLALQGSLNSLVDVDEEELDRRKQVITGQMELIGERERQKAIQEQDPLFYYPSTDDGQLTSAYTEIRRTPDGKFVDLAGNEVDVTKGRYFADNGMDSWKVANTQLKELNTLTTGATDAAMAIIAYRNAVVEGGDAGVNRYVKALSGVESELTQLQVAMQQASKDGTFAVKDGEFRDMLKNIAMKSSITDMTLLNAAYAMASMRGSSGQALSDKELMQNLNALGAGKGSVRTILGMVDTAFNDMLLTGVDVKRNTMLDGIGLTPSGREFVNSTNLNDPFKTILDQAIQGTGNQKVIAGYEALINRDMTYGDKSPDQGQGTGEETQKQDAPVPPEEEETLRMDQAELSSAEIASLAANNVPVFVNQAMIDDYPQKFTQDMLGKRLKPIDQTK